MDTFDQFKFDLNEVLSHLDDPDDRPSDLVYSVLDCDPKNGAAHLQSFVIHMIESLKPVTESPAHSTAKQYYDILIHRFVLKLTQEQAAEQMHMSERNLRRNQRTAIHILARLMWEHRLVRESAQSATAVSSPPENNAQLDWSDQVRQEINSLQMNAPAAVANVEDTVQHAVDIARLLASSRKITLQVERSQTNMVTAVHPSALRQVLIMSIGLLTSDMPPGQINIRCSQQNEAVLINLTRPASPDAQLPDVAMLQQLLSSQGGGVEVLADHAWVTIQVSTPLVGKITVLVIDDNPDQVHFYQRCVTGTRYHIRLASPEEHTLESVEAIAPAVIVLDIMLPDMDGWDFLAQLHSNPATSSIPVIICSIVREENLAKALGAVRYLPKPIRYRDFLQALDQLSTFT